MFSFPSVVIGRNFPDSGYSCSLSPGVDESLCQAVIDLLRHTAFNGILDGSVGELPACNAGDIGNSSLIPGLSTFPWRRKWQPTPIFLPGESQGQRNLAGYHPWGHKESDMTEWGQYSSQHTVLGCKGIQHMLHSSALQGLLKTLEFLWALLKLQNRKSYFIIQFLPFSFSFFFVLQYSWFTMSW